ncbi:MAG: rhomboid family intramembrane serine protease [Bacteroidia bacterium]|jgi:membrane associated rhomboid family serine protease|nr:rhomboid family intramembrane serine protease [Bacteroidia bacterium]
MNLFQEFKQNYLYSSNAVNKIIGINVLVYLFFALLGVVSFLLNITNIADQISYWFTLPATLKVFITKPWSIITYMFMHSGFFHLLFNMLWFYWIGNILHEYLGSKRVIYAYVLGGIFGGLFYMLSYNIFPVFETIRLTSSAVGASAGVLSVIVATATLLPNYEIQLLLIGNVKLKWLALVIIIIDLISIPTGNSGGHIAHIAGGMFGLFYIRSLYKNININPQFTKLTSMFSKKSNLKVIHKGSGSSNTTNKPSEEEINKILDKITQSGYDSLTVKEKNILFKASKD